MTKHLASKSFEPDIPIVNPESPIKLSENCVSRLREICDDGSFLRVSVEGGGCSGFQYKFELSSKLEEDDMSFGVPGAKVVIDKSSMDYCQGSIIDYHTELIRSGFRIIGNPKAEHGCSCGTSFSIKI